MPIDADSERCRYCQGESQHGPTHRPLGPRMNCTPEDSREKRQDQKRDEQTEPSQSPTLDQEITGRRDIGQAIEQNETEPGKGAENIHQA